MSRKISQQHLAVFQGEESNDIYFATDDFQRLRGAKKEYGQLIDVHLKHCVKIFFISSDLVESPKKISILPDDTIISHSSESNDFGILIGAIQSGKKLTIWLPTPPCGFTFDQNHRIAVRRQSDLSYQWEILPDICLTLDWTEDSGEKAIFPLIVIEDPEGAFFNEIRFLKDCERRLYRKTDWFFGRRPSDVWKYLIHGSVYDPRSSKRICKRFKCQQCAYAWWSYFGFLLKKTGKQIYDVLQDEVAYSVLLDMSEDGEWGHGYWSHDMETHARFHLDGIHLLISQYEKTQKAIWLAAAKRGMKFVFDHLTESMPENGVWFLHDTLERVNGGLHARFKPAMFGKELETTLCLNTHLQALTVLSRMCRAAPEHRIYLEMFERGMRSLQKVLDYRPAELLYRLLIPLIIRNRIKLNKTGREHRSLWKRARNGFEYRILSTFFWLLRRKYPRIVFPGGFIERDMNFSFFSEIYHIINLKDLLILYQLEHIQWLQEYIKKGFSVERDYLQSLGLKNALTTSPYYIEYIDILYLYDRLIDPVMPEEMDAAEQEIIEQTGGYSLDFYASEFVQPANVTRGEETDR
jgi:hypothetical protein